VRRAAAALLLCPALLGGCEAVPGVVGAVTGIASGGFTANPAVGVIIGIGASAATDALLKYVGRARQGEAQDAIAAAAGPLPPGGAAPWRTDHTIPIGNARGEVRLVREIANPLTPCREVMFSVEEDEARAWYLTQVCRDDRGWRWAAAEPAVDRWGALH